jgi:adenylate cyclase
MTDATQRRLTVIVSVDVVGYSKLIGVDDIGTLEAMQLHRAELIDPLITRYGGHIFKTTGDGLLIEFPSVINAIQCAVNIQREMAHREIAVSKDRRIVYRIGINLGDVIHKDGDIFGDGVNVAARIEALADPGGVFITRTVFEHVSGKCDFLFEDLGEHEVKNISQPVHVFRVLLEPMHSSKGTTKTPIRVQKKLKNTQLAMAIIFIAGIAATVGWLRPWTQGHESTSQDKIAQIQATKPSIAVLPFANISDDEKQEYFSDGITEDLITDLSKISGLFVIARNSTFAYKGKSVGLRQVAKELGVRYILEGSVRKAGQRVRINAQLIDATTGGHMWADRYDGDLNDVFGLQNKVTAKIVTVLAVKLTAGEQERIVLKETSNTEAYDTFLKGWEHYQRQSPENFRKAIALFEGAINLDLKYSRAYAALSATYWQVWRRTWFGELGLGGVHAPQFLAEEFLEKAMLDPTPLALQTATSMLAQQGRHADAINEGERAIALDPNDANSYISLAGALSLAGQFEKALELIEWAKRLNPHYPPSYLYELGLTRLGMEQFDQAAATL